MAPEVFANRYEVGRPIGRGAMTRVLEAWDRQEDRHVALKVPADRLAGDEAFLERLEREAQTAASLTHPNIAAVHRVGWDSRTRFVVSELVAGRSLGNMLAGRGPLPAVGAARVAANVCAALAAAHRRGVVHGHLTPANVLLTIDGQVKVTDFRLAQAARPLAAGSDPAADLQGVGRCLAAMLTGREPVADAPIGLGSEVPAELAAILLRAAGDLQPTYRSAAELGHDLDRFLASVQQGAASTARPDVASGHDRSEVARSPTGQLVPLLAAEPPARRAAPAVRPLLTRQRRGLALTAGLVGAGLVVVGAVGLLGRQPPAPGTNQALAPASTASLATMTSQSTTSRAPATTTSPSTTGTGRASLPAPIGQTTTTTRQVVGPDQRIVPDVVGLHRQQATNVLARAHLGVQMVSIQVSDSRQVQRVIAQRPSTGQVVPAGSEVTVLVGTRRPTA